MTLRAWRNGRRQTADLRSRPFRGASRGAMAAPNQQALYPPPPDFYHLYAGSPSSPLPPLPPAPPRGEYESFNEIFSVRAVIVRRLALRAEGTARSGRANRRWGWKGRKGWAEFGSGRMPLCRGCAKLASPQQGYLPVFEARLRLLFGLAVRTLCAPPPGPLSLFFPLPLLVFWSAESPSASFRPLPASSRVRCPSLTLPCSVAALLFSPPDRGGPGPSARPAAL